MTSKKTIERAEVLLKLMRQNPTEGIWKSRTSRLFRSWAKQCGLGGIRAYAAFEGCIVHLGLQGKVHKTGFRYKTGVEWALVP